MRLFSTTRRGTFTSLSQIEEYSKRCKLQHLNFDGKEIWSKAYLPASQVTNNPRVYEFHHIHVQLIFSNELLLCCSPLPNWLHKKQCIYMIDKANDNLCVWRCLIISKRIGYNLQRPAEGMMRDALNLAH